MKTNESVILAHGWRKWYNGESYQRYSKKINNELVIICLGKNGNLILHKGYQYNIEMYIAIAEEMKLLNVKTTNSKDKDSVRWKFKQDKASNMASIKTLNKIKHKLTPDEYNTLANDLSLLARLWYAVSCEDDNYFYIDKTRDDGSITKFLQRRHKHDETIVSKND